MNVTQPTFVLVLFVLVFSADTAITNARANSVIRAVVYGLVAVLALIAALVLLGVNVRL